MLVANLPLGRCLCLALVLGVAACLALGCGKPAAKLVPVAGRVLVDGEPVNAGALSFRADAAKGNSTLEIPTAKINADGSFQVETSGKKGAPPGWYKVLVFGDNFTADDVPKEKPLVHRRYLEVNTTDLAVEVVANPPEGAYTLKLNR